MKMHSLGEFLHVNDGMALIICVFFCVFFASTEHKILNVGPTEPWSVREKLCLASSVMRSGDQNW